MGLFIVIDLKPTEYQSSFLPFLFHSPFLHSSDIAYIYGHSNKRICSFD